MTIAVVNDPRANNGPTTRGGGRLVLDQLVGVAVRLHPHLVAVIGGEHFEHLERLDEEGEVERLAMAALDDLRSIPGHLAEEARRHVMSARARLVTLIGRLEASRAPDGLE